MTGEHIVSIFDDFLAEAIVGKRLALKLEDIPRSAG